MDIFIYAGIYLVISGMVFGITLRILEVSGDNNESGLALICGFIWPLSVPIIFIGYGSYRLLKRFY